MFGDDDEKIYTEHRGVHIKARRVRDTLESWR